MVIAITLLVVGLVIFCFLTFSDYEDTEVRIQWVIVPIVMILGSAAGLTISGYNWGEGHLAVQKDELNPGEIYTLLTDCVKVSREDTGLKDDSFCAIIKTDDGRVRAVYLKKPIPKRGVVAKDQDGEMFFAPLEEPSPTPKPEEKSPEKTPEKK